MYKNKVQRKHLITKPSNIVSGQGSLPVGILIAIRVYPYSRDGGDCYTIGPDQWGFIIESLTTQKLFWKCIA